MEGRRNLLASGAKSQPLPETEGPMAGARRPWIIWTVVLAVAAVLGGLPWRVMNWALALAKGVASYPCNRLVSHLDEGQD